MTAATLTIADFLLARIADDGAVARNWDSDAECRVASMWVSEHSYTTIASGRPGQPWFADGHEVDDPQHVSILFDPARVLAECAAKRQIVERLHVECSGHPGPHMPHADYGPGFCWRADEDSDILRALASVYADHSDYRSEWAS